MRTSGQTSTPTAPLPVGEPAHYGWIDALRGLAILAVMVVHSSLCVKGLPRALEAVASQGARGVQLFFVVSALTLMHSLKKREDMDGYLMWNYGVRRFFRIAPLFWAAIGIYLLRDGLSPRYWAPEGITGVDIGFTATFLHTWKPNAITSVVPGGWSISAEAMFYLLLPLLFRRVRSLPDALLLGCGAFLLGRVATKIVSSALGGSYAGEDSRLFQEFCSLWFPNQSYIFALGIIAFFVIDGFCPSWKASPIPLRRLPPSDRRSAIGFHLCWLIGCVGLSFSSGGYRYLPQHFLFGLVFVGMVFAFARHPLPSGVNAFTRHLGKVSYSAYFIHFFVLERLTFFLSPRIRAAGIPSAAEFALVFGACLVLTVTIATVMYELIEKPGMNYGKRFLRR